MTITEKVTALNLNVAVPRSSKDTLAGLAHLPRMIDKARALRNNTLGEYIYPCPLDWHVLNFLATDNTSARVTSLTITRRCCF